MSVDLRNGEGYADPTAFEALSAIERGERQALRAFRPIIYVCSPYAGDVESNVKAAQRYSRFAVETGYIPIAPHLLFPQFLHDDDPRERELGLFFGNALMSKCSEVWVFGSTISPGMEAEIKRARWKNYRLRYFTEEMEEITNANLTQYDVKTEDVKPDIRKIADRTIHDITKANLSQVPRNRDSNKIEFIVVHYLGVPNADNPNLYGGGYGGHYNIKRDGSVYKAADPKTAVVWHCGGGLQGSGGHSFYQICTNFNSIGLECGVCYTENVKEASGDSDKWYFTTETQESLVWLVSRLMDEYGISADHVIRHYDVTGKICPNPYVKNNRLKTSWTWDEFKTRLAEYRKTGGYSTSGTSASTEPEKWYRVRKSWTDASSQIGAYKVLENAKEAADEHPGYTVYDWNGKAVYAPAAKTEVPFLVRVSIDDLNIRTGPYPVSAFIRGDL